MIYLKFLVFLLIDWALYVPFCIAAFPVSLFTADNSYKTNKFLTWFITFDNPAIGDAKWQREGWFPYCYTGIKGWLNRAGWIIRNPLYGLGKAFGIKYAPQIIVSYVGNAEISDKYARSGWYFATAKKDSKTVAFEFYAIIPWTETKCTRIRLGWKIMTDKFKSLGFAPLVNTVTVWKEFGESIR